MHETTAAPGAAASSPSSAGDHLVPVSFIMLCGAARQLDDAEAALGELATTLAAIAGLTEGDGNRPNVPLSSASGEEVATLLRFFGARVRAVAGDVNQARGNLARYVEHGRSPRAAAFSSVLEPGQRTARSEA